MNQAVSFVTGIVHCRFFLTVLILACLFSKNQSIRVLNNIFLNQNIQKPAAIFTAAILSSLSIDKGQQAIAATPQPIIISGSIRLSEDIFKDGAPSFSPNSAIYATIRQDLGTWTSAVRNIKAPPVLSKRIALTELDADKQLKELFPIKISVESTVDSTAEGLALLKDWSSGRTPLTVSVRLDDDGVASTRSPRDLVGQSFVSKNKDGSWSEFDVKLVGRGVVGKFITSDSNAAK